MHLRIVSHCVLSVIAGAATAAIAAIAFTYLPPLATHRVTVPLNSAATATPVAVKGIFDVPRLFFRENERQRWQILGGALLQIGLSRASVPVLERAVANDERNANLRVALGEAIALANGGLITDRAKTEFEFALNGDPNDLVSRFYMGHWLLQNGKPKPALVKWVGLMRTVGNDKIWYDRLWAVMPLAAEQVGISELALQALCTAGM